MPVEAGGEGSEAAPGGGLEQVGCALCGARDEKVMFMARDLMFPGRRQAWRTVRCRVCGLVYLNPRPAAIDRTALYGQGYPFAAGARAQPLEHYQPVFDHLAGLKPGRLLDVGTGNSEFLPAMRSRGWQVEGTEVDASLVGHFRDQHGINLFLGNLEEADYDSEYFDVITIMGVVEHVADPGSFLDAAARMLKRDGILVLWMFNRNVEARLLGRYWPGFDAPRHIYSYSRATATRLLESRGFEVTGSYDRPVSYLFYGGLRAAIRVRDRLRGVEKAVSTPRLPRPLELLSQPLARGLAAAGQSANLYLFARKR